MRKTSIALAVALLAAGCTQRPSLESRQAHGAGDAAKSPVALAQAPVPPGDPHAVDRATTSSDYCVACHVGLDDDNDHPVRVSLAAAAAATPAWYRFPPASNAIVLGEGVYVHCTSCHDDGSAGYPKRVALQNVCAACHDHPELAPNQWPTVTVLSPASGSAVSGTITVTADAADDLGVLYGELWLGPVPGQSTTWIGRAVPAGNTLTFSLDTAALPDGPVYLMVRAFDGQGEWGEGMTQVVVSNAPPPAFSVAIASPQEGYVVYGQVTVEASAPGAVRAELWAGATADAGSLVSSAEGADAFSLPLDTTALGEGAAALVVRAFAADGRTASATVSVWVDNVDDLPVAITIQSPATNAQLRGTVPVQATAANASRMELWYLGDVGVGLLLDARAVGPDGSYAFALDTTKLPDGSALLTFLATSPTGGGQEVSVATWVDNTPPALAITAPASGSTLRNTTIVTATASDASGVASVAFYVDGALLATRTSAPYSVTWTPARRSGAHTLTAVATDVLGNQATSAPVVVTAR